MQQGQRQRRLEERQKRLEREEEERKKIDIEEALFQAEKRKAAIEKAKLQQYYQTDRIKGLHVSVMIYFCNLQYFVSVGYVQTEATAATLQV